MVVDVMSPRAVAEAWFAALDRGDIPAAVALLADDIYFASWMKIENGKIVWWKSYCDPSPIIAAFRGDASQRLLQAVKANNLDDVTYLLGHKINPNVRDETTGLTALMLAACHAQPA